MRSVAAVVALVVCVHAGLWALLQRQQPVPDFDRVLPSISYTPYSYSRLQHPEDGPLPTADRIRTELKLLTPYARAVRTYSATDGVEQVPAIAAELGLKVWVGVYLDDRVERDGRELQSAIDLARRYNNVSTHRGRERDDKDQVVRHGPGDQGLQFRQGPGRDHRAERF